LAENQSEKRNQKNQITRIADRAGIASPVRALPAILLWQGSLLPKCRLKWDVYGGFRLLTGPLTCIC